MFLLYLILTLLHYELIMLLLLLLCVCQLQKLRLSTVLQGLPSFVVQCIELRTSANVFLDITYYLCEPKLASLDLGHGHSWFGLANFVLCLSVGIICWVVVSCLCLIAVGLFACYVYNFCDVFNYFLLCFFVFYVLLF